jgi:type I restriction enzyme S subunit
MDAIQSLITKYKEQLDDYDNLAKSIFNEMFGDVVSNDKGWESQLFGNLFILKSGDGLSSKQQLGGEYPVYGGNGINGQHCKYNKDGEYIIIGRVGAYCGNVRLVKGRFWLTDNGFELVVKKNNQIKLFLKYLLTSLHLGRYAHKAAQPVISNLVLKNISVPLPPLPLQQTFAARITAIESQKDQVKQQITDLQTLFDSRMQYYFD